MFSFPPTTDCVFFYFAFFIFRALICLFSIPVLVQNVHDAPFFSSVLQPVQMPSRAYPMSKIVGQDMVKLALLLAAGDWNHLVYHNTA